MEGETEMSLNEKAKTLGCYHCSCCRFYHGLAKGCELSVCAYILRKDAQQEIDKQEQEWEVVMGDAEKDCYKCYSQMERER
ncbi:hypothetical protein MUO79_02145, partial [Candidatus Bathyarchaeota archaeon]|nr:hypothetical protein [Candidatus Bathyarchaeota archaeon]